MDQTKVEDSARKLFQSLIESELSEAEVVSAVSMTLAMRLAYSSTTIEDLETKLYKFPDIFIQYARLNLQTAQAAMLQKAEDMKGMH